MTEERYVEELWAYDDIMVKDNETGEELWNNMIYERMNEQDEQIKELERENKSYMSDAIKFEKECKRLYNNLRLTNSDLCYEKIMHNHCKEENKQLKQSEKDCQEWNHKLINENEQLKREKERYKRLSEIRNENINNRILSLREFINNCEDEKVKNELEDLFYSEVKEYDLAKENRKLKEEKEFWKGDACKYSNYLSILSMDCQIVQEAICDLEKVIDVDTEASKLLDELDDKFDDLNQHRLRVGYYTDISKRYCKNCKNLGIDGMFGLICDVNGNNENYDCPKYEEIE